jgi:hypothetical protein
MGKINADWHKKNRMPKNATIDQRVKWHVAHIKACGCRDDIPQSVIKELKARGEKIPTRRDREGSG